MRTLTGQISRANRQGVSVFIFYFLMLNTHTHTHKHLKFRSPTQIKKQTHKQTNNQVIRSAKYLNLDIYHVKFSFNLSLSLNDENLNDARMHEKKPELFEVWLYLF